MDILEFLPFIIAIIIYLVQQALKANKDSSKSSPPMDSDNGGGRPKSFEELLEEIQGSKESSERAEDYESYEEYEPEPVRQSSREYSGEAESSVVERFRKSVKEAENTVKIEDKRSTDLDKGLRFEEFKIKKKKTEGSRYKKMLRNRKSAKDAIILSEILRRKY
ncbi:hypothetical protein OO013_10480 [Mangrovivirga sp. M17]|uniref:Uncharacterized protein n=1 Tax=Mangrovivirga halotolerans TaxID=2993936 RepID=A0ABT3RT25_9BACT|nr:hypothetical protein [Mangrovivirga halotolerans]MCX2744295.1 hypothetical protein [Mangrovivirga halotolerans]